MKKVFNKLVRDNIPDIIISLNRKCTVKTLSDDEYQAMLDAKLNEELSENTNKAKYSYLSLPSVNLLNDSGLLLTKKHIREELLIL